MTELPSKTHVAAERLFIIAVQKEAAFLEDELDHMRSCIRCLERFYSFVRHNIHASKDGSQEKDSLDTTRV